MKIWDESGTFVSAALTAASKFHKRVCHLLLKILTCRNRVAGKALLARMSWEQAREEKRHASQRSDECPGQRRQSAAIDP
jgi:hypothetical protein